MISFMLQHILCCHIYIWKDNVISMLIDSPRFNFHKIDISNASKNRIIKSTLVLKRQGLLSNNLFISDPSVFLTHHHTSRSRCSPVVSLTLTQPLAEKVNDQLIFVSISCKLIQRNINILHIEISSTQRDIRYLLLGICSTNSYSS